VFHHNHTVSVRLCGVCANFSPHLLLLSIPLNYLQWQYNVDLTLIWLDITPIYEISAFCDLLSVSRKLSDSHIICINFSSRIPYHRWLQHPLTDTLSDSYAIHQFLSLFDDANLTQHVSLSPTVISLPISSTDHFPIICSLKITYSPTVPKTKCLTRAIRAINITELCHDILSSCLITHPPSTLSDLVDCYNSTISQLLNKHAPLKTKIIRTKPRNPWFTQALKKLNFGKCHLVISITEFCHDIPSSCLITHPPSTLSDLVDCFNSTLSTSQQTCTSQGIKSSKIIRT